MAKLGSMSSAGTRLRESTKPTSRGGIAAWACALPVLLVYSTFLILPIVQLVGSSLRPDSGRPTTNYEHILTDGYYVGALASTFTIALSTAIAVLVVAFPVALFLRVGGRSRRLVALLVIAPMFTGAIVRIYGWQLILVREVGLFARIPVMDHVELYTTSAVVLGLVSLLLPLAVLPIYASLVTVDLRAWTAARSLGATGLRALWTVLVPMCKTGFTAAGSLVFVISATTVGVPTVLGGSRVTTTPMIIFQQYQGTQNHSLAASLSIVLTVMVGVVAMVFSQLDRARKVRA